MGGDQRAAPPLPIPLPCHTVGSALCVSINMYILEAIFLFALNNLLHHILYIVPLCSGGIKFVLFHTHCLGSDVFCNEA